MNTENSLQIINTDVNDIDFIFSLFNSAIEYQKKNGYDLWPEFKREWIETEISERRHWKILDGDTIIAVFSVLYNDPIIWKERDQDPSVYLHRIAVNPLCKGKNSMAIIKHWAIKHAKENNKTYVRMDTWGNNENIRQYYINCGYPYIGQQYLDEVKDQPMHYGGSVLSLFQIEV